MPPMRMFHGCLSSEEPLASSPLYVLIVFLLWLFSTIDWTTAKLKSNFPNVHTAATVRALVLRISLERSPKETTQSTIERTQWSALCGWPWHWSERMCLMRTESFFLLDHPCWHLQEAVWSKSRETLERPSHQIRSQFPWLGNRGLTIPSTSPSLCPCPHLNCLQGW